MHKSAWFGDGIGKRNVHWERYIHLRRVIPLPASWLSTGCGQPMRWSAGPVCRTKGRLNKYLGSLTLANYFLSYPIALKKPRELASS